MIELTVLVVVVAGVGLVRPRWSSLLVACVPAAPACAWLFLAEDVPGEETGAADAAWYAGMSAVVGAGFAIVCGLGVMAGRALQRRRMRA